MANYVTISTIAPRPLQDNPSADQPAVDRMIDWWRGRLEKVLPDRPDLIVVPEVCDRYPAHSMAQRKAYYRQRGAQVRDFFASVAAEHRCYLTYPAAWEMPDGTWRNMVQLLGRDGEVVGQYNKNHLVITEITEGGLLGGREAPVLECDFGRVGIVICFDLSFQPLLQQYMKHRPDLLLFCSMYHGGLMQPYWAYACQAHLVSAVAGLPSGMISPVGQPLAHTTNYFDHVTQTVNLDCRVAHLDFNWKRLEAMKAKYGRYARYVDPGFLASVLISSESDAFTVDDLVREFEIELLDDYLARSLAHQCDPMNLESEPAALPTRS